MAKQLMITGNPFPEEPVPSEEETAEGLNRQELKNSESIEYVQARENCLTKE